MLEAILQKRVILGMFPDDAQGAAGEFLYQVRADETQWGTNYFPPEVIFSQRSHPDFSEIELTFRNCTQFSTHKAVSFTVTFRQGRAVSIIRN